MSEQSEFSAAWQALRQSLDVTCQLVTKRMQEIMPVVAEAMKQFFPDLEAQRRTQKFIRRHRHEVNIILRHSRRGKP
jgi:hypothetical protein